MILSKIPAPIDRGGVHGETYLQIELRSGKSGRTYIALSSHKNVPSRFNAASEVRRGESEMMPAQRTLAIYPEQIDGLVRQLQMIRWRLKQEQEQ